MPIMSKSAIVLVLSMAAVVIAVALLSRSEASGRYGSPLPTLHPGCHAEVVRLRAENSQLRHALSKCTGSKSGFSNVFFEDLVCVFSSIFNSFALCHVRFVVFADFVCAC